MKRIFVKPVGRVRRNTEPFALLSPNGAYVAATSYWLRRLKAGEVITPKAGEVITPEAGEPAVNPQSFDATEGE